VLPQDALVRTVAGPGGPRIGRHAPGRGAWVCSLECFDRAAKRRGFERAWRHPVSAAALATLRIEVEAVITNMEELSAVGGAPTLRR
jgi:predicted RNA-binding protein YlxR (DUF448 family)